MADDAKTFMVEDARLIFRNFSGEPTKYNVAGGKREFAVILDPDAAKAMLEDGWNVKYLTARDEDEEPTPYIQVGVNFKIRPPRITMITSNNRTLMTEETVGVLDWADLATVDLIARAYDWEVGDKTGTKAYLQTMFATLDENYLERKYAGIAEESEG